MSFRGATAHVYFSATVPVPTLPVGYTPPSPPDSSPPGTHPRPFSSDPMDEANLVIGVFADVLQEPDMGSPISRAPDIPMGLCWSRFSTISDDASPESGLSIPFRNTPSAAGRSSRLSLREPPVASPVDSEVISIGSSPPTSPTPPSPVMTAADRDALLNSLSKHEAFSG